MLFTEANFVVLFLIAIPLYYLFPAKWRKEVLLVLSLGFYAQFGIVHLLCLVGFSALIYCGGLLLHRFRKKQLIYLIYFILGILVLVYSKNYSIIASILGVDPELHFNLILPVGMSFFMLQGLSYLADVKNEKVAVEYNILTLTLYLCYFPCVVSGPIQKGEKFLPLLKNPVQFEPDKVKKGLIQMMWGYFQKLVISNRLAIFVDNIFSGQEKGTILWLGIIVFGIQLYIDFCGYSDIVIGLSKTLGIDLDKNFNFPYKARTISEFWRRWHISLSSWLKNYIYIPLGGNRKGTFRKWINIIIVFCVSGLWHGGGLSFIAWGLLHAFYQIIGEITRKVRRKIQKVLRIDENDQMLIWAQRLIVFVLVDFAWVFFKSTSLNAAINYIQRMFTTDVVVLLNGGIVNYGLDLFSIFVVLFALFFFYVGQKLRYKNDVFSLINSSSPIFQWGLFIVAIMAVVCFGIYGSGDKVIPFNYFMF